MQHHMCRKQLLPYYLEDCNEKKAFSGYDLHPAVSYSLLF